ncbi:MAG: hypothetical protein R3B13_16650 [Polyangiaceae bacterium]
MRHVVLEPDAERDIADACDWYDEQRPGLGDRDSEDTLVVVACFHGKRDPAVWRRRL